MNPKDPFGGWVRFLLKHRAVAKASDNPLVKILNELQVLAGIKADATVADVSEFEEFAKMAGLPAKAGEAMAAKFKALEAQIAELTTAKAAAETRATAVEAQMAELKATIDARLGDVEAKAKAFHDKGVAVFASVEAAVAQIGKPPVIDEKLQEAAAKADAETDDKVKKALAGEQTQRKYHFSPNDDKGRKAEQDAGYRS